MSRWRVTFERIDSFTVEVEADSAGEAVDRAYETEHYQEAPSLCAHCCNAWGKPEQPVIDESGWEIDDERGVVLLDEQHPSMKDGAP